MAHSQFHSLTLEEMMGRIAKAHPEADVSLIQKAYHFAANAHNGQSRMNGEPYFTHPQFVASILCEIMLDVPTVAAGLLHDTVEDCEGITLDTIKQEFGEEVAVLVDGVTKLGRLHFQDKEEQHAESLRKMILAMGRDIRVVIVKLADRLHNMLTLGFQKQEKQVSIAKETLEIYAPIAHRLGVYTIKQELEDLALSFIDPEGYRDVAAKVGTKRQEREEQIKTIIGILQEKLPQMGIEHFEIAGRPKHLYSIYRKMNVQHKTFDQIYDLIAVRVLVDTVGDCYTVLGAVHTLWNYMPMRLKDYISTPKNNMYQSLHTTLVGGRQIPTAFEVQIRTHEMHKVAEYGIAAHWNYKDGGKDKELDKKLYWLRQILDWQSETKDSKEFVDGLKTDLFSEEVFVFTPKGDIINMQRGATPLDFAYRIHSGVGNICSGAKINGKMVPLDTVLKNGDWVEILTNKASKGPSLDWLKIVKTQQAKSKIRAFFKKELREENTALGREMLEHEAKRRGVKLGEISRQEFFEPMLKKYGFSDIESLYSGVGYGAIPTVYVISQLLDEKKRAEDAEKPQEKKQLLPEVHQVKPQGKPTHGVYVEGGSGMLVRFAHCCNPVPGDDIVGYITRGRGVTVHKADCFNIQSFETERRIGVSWAEEEKGEFSAGLRIIAYDHAGVLGELTVFVSDSDTPVTAVSAKMNRNGTINLHMIVKVSSKGQLNQVVTRLKNRADVLDAYRTTN